jgi:ATP-dependent DNA helicase DinG
VDVPGEGLTQVIIDRIPFAHPNDPMVHARNALEGRESFVRTVLPSAKMFLRQAAGRLIRASTDHGRVVLLDSRVLGRREWKIPESLPPGKYRRLSVRG